MYRWPNVLVQFEDFENTRAVKLLERYRDRYLCFNDDIQGTGAVALAGILCSLRCRGKTFSDLSKERILVVGAGSAGMGVANTILSYAVEMCGMSMEDAKRMFWVTDNMVRKTTGNI
jgi:malic enzyme